MSGTKFPVATLDALHTILGRIDGIDSVIVKRWAPSMDRGEYAVCRAGISMGEYMRHKSLSAGLYNVQLVFQLNETWALCVDANSEVPRALKDGPEGVAPKRWSERTLSAIATLVDPGNGFYRFNLVPVEEHSPKGTMQESDFGITTREWVSQSCGMAGDDFSGTVTWKLGAYYLVGSFAM